MISKTKLQTRLERKKNPVLVETLRECKKSGNDKWMKIGQVLSGSTSKRPSVNLSELEKVKGEVIVVPGKILSQGELNKKVKVVAFGFSKSAKEKLNKVKIEFKTILEEIKSNPNADKVEILK